MWKRSENVDIMQCVSWREKWSNIILQNSTESSVRVDIYTEIIIFLYRTQRPINTKQAAMMLWLKAAESSKRSLVAQITPGVNNIGYINFTKC